MGRWLQAETEHRRDRPSVYVKLSLSCFNWTE